MPRTFLRRSSGALLEKSAAPRQLTLKSHMLKSRLKRILSALRRRYPKGYKPWATRSNPYRTVIGTILSAQTTDAQVYGVTPALFKKYPNAAKLAKARLNEVKRIIAPVGLHHAKARNIISAARMITNNFRGRVPATREELIQLPGVGRKTANVVLIKAYGRPAMPVDTHVFRVARRIGLAKGNAPHKVEAELERIIPKRNLSAAHFWMIHHGRTLCTARNPRCSDCTLLNDCTYGRKHAGGRSRGTR